MVRVVIVVQVINVVRVVRVVQEGRVAQVVKVQTWNLSKILHRRIFKLKILHRQFHLISTVLVRKKTKNE